MDSSQDTSKNNNNQQPKQQSQKKGNKRAPRSVRLQQQQSQGTQNPAPASAQTGPRSVANQSAFVRGAASDPVPQPGRFPVVFATGAGEATRDLEISVMPQTVANVSAALPGRYLMSAKLAQFQSHQGINDDRFSMELIRYFLLGLAQQVVHAHVNLSLPMGDFSVVSSADLFHFNAIRSIIQQFGEFREDSTGTRYMYHNYNTTVKSLIFAASKIDENHRTGAIEKMWLPMETGDSRTSFLISRALSNYVDEQTGVRLNPDIIMNGLFSGNIPPAFAAVDPLIPNGPDQTPANHFDWLFTGQWQTPANFHALFNANNMPAMNLLGFTWPNRNVRDLDFLYNYKSSFTSMVDHWARSRATLISFFSCGSSQMNKLSATGSPSQLATVTQQHGVTILRTRYALPPPEFSILACFPILAITDPMDSYKVVMSTPIMVDTRATEFCQRDWL